MEEGATACADEQIMCLCEERCVCRVEVEVFEAGYGVQFGEAVVEVAV